MNIQEQEERDYNPQPELVNAFARSKAETQLRDPKIDEALSRGKYVVMQCADAHCPRTDAAMGVHEDYNSEHDTLEAAQETCDWQNAAYEGNDEVLWSIVRPQVTT